MPKGVKGTIAALLFVAIIVWLSAPAHLSAPPPEEIARLRQQISQLESRIDRLEDTRQ